LRAALPIIHNGLAGLSTGDGSHVEFGHYVSLSTPHLGIQCSWGAPLQLWRNLCRWSVFISQQLVQLAVQDGGFDKPPLLVALSDPEGPSVEVLRMFQQRTCVTMASGDLLIPVASGVIDKELAQMRGGNPCCNSSTPSWCFEEGYDSACGGDVTCSTMETSKLGRDGTVARSFASMKRLFCFLAGGLRILMRLFMPAGKFKCNALGKWQGFPAVTSEARACTSSVQRLTWETSSDGACRFPLEILHGLETMPWRRKVARLHHPPFALNPHVFLIGKSSEQWSSEHKLSMQCIRQLVEEVLLDRSAQ